MSYSMYLRVGRPGDVVANHDGPHWNRRANYRRKGKRGYVHVAHLRRHAKRYEVSKPRRREDRRVIAEQCDDGGES